MRRQAKPVDAFVDSASTYEVVAACSLGSPGRCYPWAWIVVNEVTMALIFAEHLKLAPSPKPAGRASGFYEVLMTTLRNTNVLGLGYRADETSERAVEAIKNSLHVEDQLKRLRNRLRQLESDETNYRPWIDWVMRHAWVENSRRLGSLVNLEFSSEIAQILDVSEQDIASVARQTAQPSMLRASIGKESGSELALLQKAYLV
jgi:hypothetical protein